jgi:hypothetical protein
MIQPRTPESVGAVRLTSPAVTINGVARGPHKTG